MWNWWQGKPLWIEFFRRWTTIPRRVIDFPVSEDQANQTRVNKSWVQIIKHLPWKQSLLSRISWPNIACLALPLRKNLWVMLESWGTLALSISENNWSTEAEFDSSILIRHVAREICYNLEDSTADSSILSKHHISKLLSEYMLYLLVMNPSMLLVGMGQYVPSFFGLYSACCDLS